MSASFSRRRWLACAAGTAAGHGVAAAPPPGVPARPFRFCLNTSTIRGQNLPFAQEVEITARAGYDAIEPWLDELEKSGQGRGGLSDLGKRIRDQGLVVADVIAFFEWIVEEPARRKKGLEKARRAMELVRQVGGERIAAPPAGATDHGGIDLLAAADRYRALLEIGDREGVVPQAEVWGFSRTLRRLGEAAFVAVESGHPRACVLADIFHLHKGGSGFAGLRLLGPRALQVIHMNDYPADPPAATITDAQRVYPGDGVAPLGDMLRGLREVGFEGFLSLELFNPGLYKQDALHVARTGLEKMRALAAASARAG
jgi:sugar phosphate isomerase/epimerase